MDVIPSGSILLDAALGVGGYPRGRVVEIYGPESSGKTTLALHAIAESQKQGGIAAFVDAEHALDPVYAKNLGVNVDELWVSQPDTGEQALEIVESLVRSGAMDIIVVDSVAALTPRAEIEGDMGDSHMGLQARLMSQALRKLTATISKTRTCLIFINQIRMKIGVMFGNPETTTGGFALKFYSSLRLEVRKVESIARGNEEVVGNKVRVKVVKNKVAPAVPQGGDGHHVRQGDLRGRQPPGGGPADQPHREGGKLVFVRQGEDRPGRRECTPFPGVQPRRLRGRGKEGPGSALRQARRRRPTPAAKPKMSLPRQILSPAAARNRAEGTRRRRARGRCGR